MLESVLKLWPPRILGAPLIPMNVSDEFQEIQQSAKDPKAYPPIIYLFLLGR